MKSQDEKLRLSEIKRGLDILLDHVATVHGLDEVAPGEMDMYWSMLDDDWLDITDDPKLNIGSLCDDISSLHRMLQSPEKASAVDLERMANVLRLLSVKISSS